MFTYIRAKNFKSLKEINCDLNRIKIKPNNFIVIYGENGSSKTNMDIFFKKCLESV